MKRGLEIFGTLGLLLLLAPALLFTALVLFLKGVRPLLVREKAPDNDSPALLLFNARGEGRIQRWIRAANLDLPPGFASVLAGSSRFPEVHGACRQVAGRRSGNFPRRSVAGRIALAALLLAAFVLLALAAFAGP